MHLADAFMQSDLLHSGYNVHYVFVSTLCVIVRKSYNQHHLK